MLFWVTPFVWVCYSGHRKQVYVAPPTSLTLIKSFSSTWDTPTILLCPGQSSKSPRAHLVHFLLEDFRDYTSPSLCGSPESPLQLREGLTFRDHKKTSLGQHFRGCW